MLDKRLEIKKLTEYYLRYRPIADVLLFIAITVLAHELYWRYIEGLASLPWMAAARNFMREILFAHSAFFLNLMFPYTNKGTTFLFPDIGYIDINNSCTGIKQFYQIIVLFLLFPGPWKHKTWYIPMSILIMHGVNIFRIVTLGIVLHTFPQAWDFTHDWILRPFFYVVIFLLWVFWNEKFRKKPAIL